MAIKKTRKPYPSSDGPDIGFKSKRQYSLAWIENSVPQTMTAISIFDLFDVKVGAYAYCNAAQQNADEILDLQVGERMPMDFNLKNPDSSGYIIRIK